MLFQLRTKNDRELETANGAARQGAWSYTILVLNLYGFKFWTSEYVRRRGETQTLPQTCNKLPLFPST